VYTIAIIQSRKGQQVILKHQYSFQLKTKPKKINQNSNHIQENSKFNDHDSSEDEMN